LQVGCVDTDQGDDGDVAAGRTEGFVFDMDFGTGTVLDEEDFQSGVNAGAQGAGVHGVAVADDQSVRTRAAEGADGHSSFIAHQEDVRTRGCSYRSIVQHHWGSVAGGRECSACICNSLVQSSQLSAQRARFSQISNGVSQLFDVQFCSVDCSVSSGNGTRQTSIAGQHWIRQPSQQQRSLHRYQHRNREPLHRAERSRLGT
jgi:hypothetical protein